MSSRLRCAGFRILLLGLLLAACRSPEGDETPAAQKDQTPQAAAATQLAVEALLSPEVITPEATLPPTPTLFTDASEQAPGAVVTTAAPAVEPTAVFDEQSYQVVFVLPDDVLNVRGGAGVDNDPIGGIAPGVQGLNITGPGTDAAGSAWVPIANEELSGWVNSRFLTTVISSEQFCQDTGPKQLLNDLAAAVQFRDGQALAGLVDDGRDLRIRRHWWNPEVALSSAELIGIFDSNTSYDWGTANGSGDSLAGSFSDQILPLLDNNLPLASEIGCDEILHGGTAGLVQLPPEYNGVHYYSLYRPPAEGQSEFDWSTWVIGIEWWQERYVLSFLVHFEWEI